MEENKEKIDGATSVNAEKLSEEELSEVAGGSMKEQNELWQTLLQSSVPSKYGWNGFNMRFYSFERIFSDFGIEISTSEGFLDGGVSNTYRDKETGQFIRHSEVLRFLKTGEKEWR